MEMAKVTSKGQITIPVSIRRRLSINEGDKLLFIDSPDGVVMVNPDMLPAGQDPETLVEARKAPAPANRTQSDPRPARMESSAFGDSGASPSGSRLNPAASPAHTRDGAPASSAENEPRAKALDVSALLDEIRSIGSNTLK